jgi:hypothetical protein
MTHHRLPGLANSIPRKEDTFAYPFLISSDHFADEQVSDARASKAAARDAICEGITSEDKMPIKASTRHPLALFARMAQRVVA